MNEIRVIDLLNQLNRRYENNGEPIPNKIRVRDKIYVWNNGASDYHCNETGKWLIEDFLKSASSLDVSVFSLSTPIEEDKINCIGNLEKCNFEYSNDNFKAIDSNFEILKTKINEILEYMNSEKQQKEK